MQPTFCLIDAVRLKRGAFHFLYGVSLLWMACFGLASLVCGADASTAPVSKKGLQVQMVDDALALGIKHAGLNVSLPALAAKPGQPHTVSYKNSDGIFAFREGPLQNLDREVAPLSKAGVQIYAILLAPVPQDTEIKALTVHPAYTQDDKQKNNGIAAFNTETKEGRAWLRAVVEFLAKRYDGSIVAHGCIAHWIVGNEVNSHWWWYNMGDATAEQVASSYEQATRIVWQATTAVLPHARVYLSLEHHWGIRYKPGSETRAMPGKQLLEIFGRLAKERGDFPWHLAHHPYPENLGRPAFWNDQTAKYQPDSPRITFRNLSVLTDWLQQPEYLWKGQARRVILSEQGFHYEPSRVGAEDEQAAAYCAAWRVVDANPGIDAFILHRHVDHSREGLNLGLWSHKEGTIATPDKKRRIYEVFAHADQPDWQESFAFALPIIGIPSWDKLEERLRRP